MRPVGLSDHFHCAFEEHLAFRQSRYRPSARVDGGGAWMDWQRTVQLEEFLPRRQ